MKNFILALLSIFTFSINAESQCDANFTYTYVSCDSVWFIPVSFGPQYTYSWDFGDSGSSTDATPAHQYSGDGTYFVVLTINDTLAGCSDVLTVPVTIACGIPCTVSGAFASSVDSSDCSVSFVSTAFGGSPPYTYFWEFGDGGTSTDANPIHQYPFGTAWTPCLTITDGSGCDTTICDVVFVFCTPTSCNADFTYTYIACDSVWFIPTSAGPQYTYDWDFGDGSSSTQSTPAHQYTSDGTYFVILTINDTVAGCSNVLTVPVTIACGTSCTVNGDFVSYVDSSNCSVDFVSTAFGGSPPYTYYWEFGDGGTSTDPNPTHLYPFGTAWTTCLTITDGSGCDTTICDIVFVFCTPTSCDAQFTYTYAACDSVWFIPVSTGPQYSYNWDFGDGSSSTSDSPAHQYSSNGTYAVILTIVDSISGCSDFYTMLITVNCGASPCTVVGDFATSVDSMNCNVSFVSTAFGGTAPYTYFWEFGDGSTSSNPNPTHQYPFSTVWTPCLTITDASGCDTTICDIVIIDCIPSSCDAQFTYTYPACDSVWFIPVSSGSQYDYYWDFGDGATSTDASPSHQYASNGTYYVILTIIDSTAGCSDVLTVPVTINCGFTPCTVVGDFGWYTDSTTCEVVFVSTAFAGTAPYSYFWNFGDGNTSALANPSNLYVGATVWTPCLTISDANGCDTTICNVISVDCASMDMDEFDTIENLIIYPNPGKDIFNILYKEITVISVYDISGKLVWSNAYNDNPDLVSLNLSDLDNGTYVILISNDKSLVSRKLIKY